MPYTHLTDAEREVIGQMHHAGHSFSEIARELGRDKSTIWREFVRNRSRIKAARYVRFGYYAGGARVKANERRRQAKKGLARVLDHQPLLDYVRRSLEKRWSPEQIAGRIRLDFPRDRSMRISHETIYQWLRQDKRSGGKLYKYLRQSNKKRRKKYGSTLKRYRIQNRVSIEQRPQAANLRKRIGDWEGDTMEGKNHQGRLLTLVDRKSRYTMALKLPNKVSANVIRAIHRSLGQLPRSARRTLTLDNGTEFTHFKEIEDRLGTQVYFAHPYCSWERGTNENTNGLLRQYFPKQIDLTQISHQQLASSVIQINNRPRKCLNWRTPKEVFLAS